MPFPVRSEGGAAQADIADGDQDDLLAPSRAHRSPRTEGYEKLQLLACWDRSALR
jgi:hypothetical protein